ncbi:SUN domain-containing protein 2 [Podarcis raffonei]|uniref:SUN domain-containing protein 2 n=1 Tax=Podarcis raffonei TaxID=65483 RepID=UPI0023292F47|nr:SUN domain-containing protein 2 [Podarcis raffonei]XP_053263278.1 SUN domain-containing protein 2 [Podarcis raffonei]
MSRRSQRLGTVRYYQNEDDDNISNSGGSSLLGSQHILYKDGSDSRSLRRKSSSVKRPSPAPSLGSNPAAHTTSYYSESVVSESYLGDGRGLSGRSSALLDDPLDRNSYWSEELSARRRRGTGGSESSKKINGLVERKTYDTYASSSGYSSEDDYAGHTYLDQNTSGSVLRNAISKAGSFLWLVLTSPGRVFGLLYWWMGTAWYRLTTAASLLDVFVLTRSYPILKKLLLLLLLLLLLTAIGYGAWYFYPFGLHPSVFSWGSVKLSSPVTKKGDEARDFVAFSEGQQQVLSRLQALERHLESLEGAVSVLELQRGEKTMEGAALSHDDTLSLLDGLVRRRETILREEFRAESDLHLQKELDAFRSQLRKDFDSLLKKVSQASEETETRMLQMTSQWQSSTQEGLMGNFQKEMERLEAQLTGLKKEFMVLASDQKRLSKHVDSLPGQIKEMREDVEIQFPVWLSRFLSQAKRDGTGSLFLHREELEEQLLNLEQKILAKVSEDQRLSARDVGVVLQREGVIGVTEEQVHQIVNQALKRYSDDRIGMVDYALESAGASVISTRCSETYETKTALLSLFGIPLWYHSQSPRVILQPDVHPGNCWAFQGSQGFAVIRLSSNIRPTAVTLEHISKALSPKGTIPSAPKDFAVYGLTEEGQQEGTLLGQFTYSQDGDPIQTFHLQDEGRIAAFQLIELRVLSNWGHPEYTCIYRFRVHGEPVP